MEREVNMLSIEKRQTYLKQQGLYKGKIDGKENDELKAAYLALQKKYMRKKDCDGEYGKDTDKVLLNLARVTKRCPDFSLKEFKCDCGGRFCTGYPTYLDTNLLDNIQKVRDHYKKPVIITSGLRCDGRNRELGGSISNSLHTHGRALDFAIPPKTSTELGRLEVMKYWKKLKTSNFSYCYLPTKFRTVREKTAKYMGNAIHGDVK